MWSSHNNRRGTLGALKLGVEIISKQGPLLHSSLFCFLNITKQNPWNLSPFSHSLLKCFINEMILVPSDLYN